MTCTLIQNHLSAFCFDLLDDQENETCEQHLLQCSQCLRSYFKLKRRVASTTSELLPSKEVHSRLMQVVRRRQKRTRIGVAAFATAALLVGIIFLTHRASAPRVDSKTTPVAGQLNDAPTRLFSTNSL